MKQHFPFLNNNSISQFENGIYISAQASYRSHIIEGISGNERKYINSTLGGNCQIQHKNVFPDDFMNKTKKLLLALHIPSFAFVTECKDG